MSEIKNPETEIETSPEKLEAAANEWAPDTQPIEAPASEEEITPIQAAPAAPEPQISTPVTLIADPFGLNHHEITDAQNSSEELSIDEDLIDLEEIVDEFEEDEEPIAQASPEQIESEMAALAVAMAVEHQKATEELEAVASQNEVEAAQELAAQIAEDEALSKHLAEAAEQEALDAIDPELLAALPQKDEEGNLDVMELESCAEALLFMSDKPISTEKLVGLLSTEANPVPFALLQEALTCLRDRYSKVNHGIELVEVGGGFQFRTKPGRAALAKKLAKISTQRLSSGAMETLAIVAYKQPVLKDDIDKIRGVDSSHFVRGLLDKKLIKISGRSELPGRPMLYTTTQEFLELFGLKDLSAMPPLRELEQMVPNSQSKNPEEDPRVKEMRRLVGEMKSDSTRLSYDPREDEKILQDIRERVTSIATSTPYIDQQKAYEKAQAEGLDVPAPDLASLLNPNAPVMPPIEVPMPSAEPQ